MMLDWVMSIMIASLVALTLIGVGVAEVRAAGDSAEVGAQLGAIATDVAQVVDEDAALSIAVSEYFNFSTTGSSGAGLELPSFVDGYGYTVTLTSSFVLLSATVQGSQVSESADFNTPLHVWPSSVLTYVYGQMAQGGEIWPGNLESWDNSNLCLAFGPGGTLVLHVLPVEIAGVSTFLPVLTPLQVNAGCHW